MRKKLTLSLISLVLIFAVIIYSNSGAYMVKDNPPPCCVKVVQDAQPNVPVNNVEVVWYQNGQEVGSKITQGEGKACESFQVGYYDIYAYYPPRPNNQQSGKLLNHYHQILHEDVIIMLSPPY